MARLQRWEPAQFRSIQALLSSRQMPELVYDEAVPANPALICMAHAVDLSRGSQYLPCIDLVQANNTSDEDPPPSGRRGENNPPGDVDLGEEAFEVGDIVWLFDRNTPYLAEVFKDSEVPKSRLPHLDRTHAKGGQLVCRIIGAKQRFIRTISHRQTTLPFTTMCAAPLSGSLHNSCNVSMDVNVHTGSLCSTGDLEALVACGAYKRQSRSRRATSQELQAAIIEARALLQLAQGETAGDVPEEAVELVKDALAREARGASSCGECAECLREGACMRARNRSLAARGSTGAKWAEMAHQLVGRSFQVSTSTAPTTLVAGM